jgi:hypothetical protein
MTIRGLPLAPAIWPNQDPTGAPARPHPLMPPKAPAKAPKKTAKKTAKPASKATTAKNTTTKKAPAKKTVSKTTKKAAKRSATTKAPAARTRTTKAKAQPPVYIPRAMPVIDDDDVLMAHGAGSGAGFGRCGGRMLGSQLEQTICDKLGNAGIAHSHSPRHFEVNLVEKQVAAYAPMVVLRGRGREGKSVVIESAEHANDPILKKVQAFRAQYGQEYYVTFIAPEEVLDEVALATYDEACAETDLNTLIARLAE